MPYPQLPYHSISSSYEEPRNGFSSRSSPTIYRRDRDCKEAVVPVAYDRDAVDRHRDVDRDSDPPPGATDIPNRYSLYSKRIHSLGSIFTSTPTGQFLLTLILLSMSVVDSVDYQVDSVTILVPIESQRSSCL